MADETEAWYPKTRDEWSDVFAEGLDKHVTRRAEAEAAAGAASGAGSGGEGAGDDKPPKQEGIAPFLLFGTKRGARSS